MVLTNFECWANVGNADSVAADIEHYQLHGSSIGAGVAASRQVDLFNPRAVQQNLGPVTQEATQSPTAGVSHISSNGYYGFAHVNAVHELNNNNNNNNISCINYNNNNCNNNNLNVASTRCKKRFFVPNDDEMFAQMMCGDNEASAATTVGDNNMVHGHCAAAKRCRYDDDFAAQYFNDFFNMQSAAPPTQIATQSCLMDTEDLNQQQQQQLPGQQQVEVAMKTPSLHSDFDSIPSNVLLARSLQQEQQQQVQQLQQQPQQVHFQGHLHRANRDVSRCMLSHMI